MTLPALLPPILHARVLTEEMSSLLTAVYPYPLKKVNLPLTNFSLKFDNINPSNLREELLSFYLQKFDIISESVPHLGHIVCDNRCNIEKIH